MKRECVLAGLFLGLSLLRLPVLGQDAAPAPAATNAANDPAPAAATRAAAVAEQQGVDEKFKRIAADIESLLTANQLLQDKVSALKDELQQIRTEQSRLAASAVTPDDLKRLAQKIEEVDKKRQEDKDTISDQIKKTVDRLEKLLAAAAEPAPKPSIKPPSTNDAPAVQNGVTYTLKEGDKLIDIVAAYNKAFKDKGMKPISLKQAMDANPNVDWTRTKVGQKIIIPNPPE
jgi:septal ring factor EnvC (AmiA/AmiB activator)